MVFYKEIYINFYSCSVIAALVISISTDSSEESVESSISLIILLDYDMETETSIIPVDIHTIIPIVPPVTPEVVVAVVTLPAGVLDLAIHLDTVFDPSEDPTSLEHASFSLGVSPFYDSEPDSEFESSRIPSSQIYRRPLLLDGEKELWHVHHHLIHYHNIIYPFDLQRLLLPLLCRHLFMLPMLLLLAPHILLVLLAVVTGLPLGRGLSSERSSYSSSDNARTLSVSATTSTPAALSLVKVDLLPPCKRLRGLPFAYHYEVSIEDNIEMGCEDCIKADSKASVGVDIEADMDTDIETDFDTDILTDIEPDIKVDVELAIKVDTKTGAEADIKADDLPVSTVGERLDEREEAIQGMYENLMEIPTQRLEDIKEKQIAQEVRAVTANTKRANVTFRSDNKTRSYVMVSYQNI
nr:hypothetical protein [Tanacetum cinerariifolium]